MHVVKQLGTKSTSVQPLTERHNKRLGVLFVRKGYIQGTRLCPEAGGPGSYFCDIFYPSNQATEPGLKYIRLALRFFKGRRHYQCLAPGSASICVPWNPWYNLQELLHEGNCGRVNKQIHKDILRRLRQCFWTFVRPRPGKFFFHKTRTRPQQIYS